MTAMKKGKRNVQISNNWALNKTDIFETTSACVCKWFILSSLV